MHDGGGGRWAIEGPHWTLWYDSAAIFEGFQGGPKLCSHDASRLQSLGQLYPLCCGMPADAHWRHTGTQQIGLGGCTNISEQSPRNESLTISSNESFSRQGTHLFLSHLVDWRLIFESFTLIRTYFCIPFSISVERSCFNSILHQHRPFYWFLTFLSSIHFLPV